ncbi:hypothetical protein NC653_034685 [Populus alba x Populus x berolinensis]|uniref:Peptidyl-prolyl cis-trans isomerase n=3 Tax=Populus TaxID=3689 RepID=A0A4U5PP60_POPAL|nr:hypothetical protein POTOM_049257 [Populus tomentosa]KAJ6970184.1 hypothetical protein NC653_034685 [Populus alba x Populus x berolinensis]TKR98166.1 hypothetical protein D5086_0000205950 [Populus alba]
MIHEKKTVQALDISAAIKLQQSVHFLIISINGEPVGRIIIGLHGEDVPARPAGFSNLVSGAAGISYRRKEFIKIIPNYEQHGGREYETRPRIKILAGAVSIIVRDPSKPPPKLKLVARQGNIEIDQDEVGIDRSSTEFVIATKDSPELDASSLIVGSVLEGMEVVDRIGQVKTSQENIRSPYFRAAKLIRGKGAVVAERGFDRPYSKVVVANCGLEQHQMFVATLFY